MARTPGTGVGRRAFLQLALAGAGAVAIGRPTWASAAPLTGIDGSPTGIAVGPGRLVAVGRDRQGGPGAWWSSDGQRWAPAAIAPGGAAILGDVTAVTGGFVAVGSTDGRPAAWWSRDGIRWSLLGALARPGHLVAVAASGRAVLTGGAEQDGESSEGTGPLLASIDRSGSWGRLSTDGVGDLRHGSITALARHGDHWVLAGTAIGAGGLWRSTSTGRRWSPALVPGREPVLWSSLLTVQDELVALGTTIAGGAVQLARSRDARSWVTGTVPDVLAAPGVDLRGVALDEADAAVVACATGAIESLVDGVLP